MKVIGMTLAALLTIAAVQDDKVQEKQEKRQMKDRVWLEGRIVCIGCTLEKELGVEAQCTLHAKHAQGFLDKDGKLWTFVDNTKGHIVQTNRKLRDKDVQIYGWKYKKHQYVELWRYRLKKKDKWIDWDYCKT